MSRWFPRLMADESAALTEFVSQTKFQCNFYDKLFQESLNDEYNIAYCDNNYIAGFIDACYDIIAHNPLHDVFELDTIWIESRAVGYRAGLKQARVVVKEVSPKSFRNIAPSGGFSATALLPYR